MALDIALPCSWQVLILSQNRRCRKLLQPARLGSTGRKKGKEGRVGGMKGGKEGCKENTL